MWITPRNAVRASQVAAVARGSAARAHSGFTAWTYHEASFKGPYARQCYARTDGAWAPVPQQNVTSSHLVKQNVWVADLKKAQPEVVERLAAASDDGMPGLRLDGKRAIRAKYPNGDPERSGSYLRGYNAGMGGGDYVQGWLPLAAGTQWVPPRRKPDSEELVFTGRDWPSIEWPMAEHGGSRWTGEGDWGQFHIGQGGYCDDLTPPTGYWYDTCDGIAL